MLMSEENAFDIAIIGMAGRFPEAKDITQFWQNIKNSKECITFFTNDELRDSGLTEDRIKDPSYVKASGVIKDIEMFDASFFGFTSREAELTDPQHRIFLECAWEALENAGCVPEKYNGIIGVFGGVSTNTYLLNNIAKSDIIDTAGIYPIMIGNEKDFLCTRVAYKLNLKGPSMTIQTACSTSLVAVHVACQSILNGECDMAIAGGATVRVPQKAGYKYQEGGILSPDGHCRAFDEDAKGTVVGDGVGIVVLKSLENAINDRDYVYAIIKGTAINNDGSSKVGFTAPSVEGQASVIQEALNIADVSSDTIGYIEAHGTGTQLGDPIEVAALKNVFQKSIQNEKFCVIGSVKANIGHLDSASGVAGLIKVALMLDKRIIPPSINFKKTNPKLELDTSPFYINTRLKEWQTSGKPRRAAVSSFGLGGTNAHVVLEELEKEEGKQDKAHGREAMYNLITISAKTATSLKNSSEKLVNYLRENPSVEIKDVAYTLAMGRKEFSNRFYCVCKDKDDFVNSVTNKEWERSQEVFESSERVTMFLFPEFDGNGKAVLKELYDSEKLFRESLDECIEVISRKLGVSLTNMLMVSEFKEQADNRYKKLAQFSLQYALAALFDRLGIHADLCAGGIIGEYVALCTGGEVTLEDAISMIGDKFEAGKEVIIGSKYKMPYIPMESMEDSRLIGSYLDSNRDKQHTLIVMGLNDMKDSFHTDVAKCLLLSALPWSKEDSSVMHLLNTLGKLWMSGVSIDWAALYKGTSCTRIPLPTYCFDKKKYWIEASQFPHYSSGTETEKESNENKIPLELEKAAISTHLKELCSEILGIEKVNDKDDLFELGADSFMILQLNNEIEIKFKLKLPLKNIIENSTVEKLSETIWNRLNHRQEDEVFYEDPIVRFRTSGSKSPIFLIHPAGGTVMGYQSLVKYLPKEYPVYGIQYTYKEDKNVVRKMEDIADDYIELITKIQPKGPIILGGHSFGGNAAFEIAIRLQKMGRDIEHLIMFDSHPPLSYYCNEVFDESMFLKSFPIICAMYFDKTLESKDIEIDSVESATNYLKSKGWIPWGFDNLQFHNYYNMWRSNHNSLRAHMPKDSYKGSLLFFRAETMQPKEILETLNITFRKGIDLEEWGKLSDLGIRLFEVPGTHYTMLNEPNVKAIAKIVNKFLV
jgi:3-oxoacyl-(acyl-carrier-protein) synthase/thioesterase domain-containing protein/acyl carrier protein